MKWWWSQLDPATQKALVSLPLTFFLTFNTALPFILIGIPGSAWGDDAAFLAYLSGHWLVLLLAYFYGAGTAGTVRAVRGYQAVKAGTLAP